MSVRVNQRDDNGSVEVPTRGIQAISEIGPVTYSEGSEPMVGATDEDEGRPLADVQEEVQTAKTDAKPRRGRRKKTDEKADE